MTRNKIGLDPRRQTSFSKSAYLPQTEWKASTGIVEIGTEISGLLPNFLSANLQLIGLGNRVTVFSSRAFDANQFVSEVRQHEILCPFAKFTMSSATRRMND